MSRIFSIVGDSNVTRHMNPMNCRDRPLMSGCEVLPCGKMSLLAEALQAVRAETSVCVVSCVTNFLTGSVSAGASVSLRVEPVLLEFCKILNKFSEDRPELSCLVTAPMYRRSPLWFRDSLPEILTKFSEVMKQRGPRVHLMSSFPTPEFEADGVHLTAYSGLAFVLHMFDTAEAVLAGLEMPPDEVATQTTETSRVLEDRMMVLEQDHRRLNRAQDTKTPEDAELFDFHENIRLQSAFIIEGLTKHPDGMPPKEWQEKVKVEVRGVLSVLLGREPPILFVTNNTSRRKDAPAKYHVQMVNLSDSQEIRDKFGEFFLGNGDKRPPALKPVSIRNKVTLATSVRVAILKVLGRRWQESNGEGSGFKVISYEPRPLLKLHLPPSTTARRVQTLNFIQAIRTLPTNFTDEEISLIMKNVSPQLHGQLRALFAVISDDMIKKRDQSSKAPAASGSGGSTIPSGGDPPQVPPGASGSKSKSKSHKSARADKRGASSPAEGAAEKQKK